MMAERREHQLVPGSRQGGRSRRRAPELRLAAALATALSTDLIWALGYTMSRLCGLSVGSISLD
jgi:hypothetical protein